MITMITNHIRATNHAIARSLLVAMFLTVATLPGIAQESAWLHSASLYILTTPDGADLPPTAREEHFPLLVRLDKDWFNFAEAKAAGEDVRFFNAENEPLAFQIERWEPAVGRAAIWVRIPAIVGNSRQEIRMKWGNADATAATDGKAVFNASNGYLSVWHLGDDVEDVVGTLNSKDAGTTAVKGMIGLARHFPGGKGVFCGDKIQTYPSGDDVHSTQAWLRPESSSGRVVGWGNEKGQGKVVMHYRSPPHVRMECYFSDANVDGTITTPMPDWLHTVHTYRRGESLVYVNGVLAGTGNPRAAPLAVERPARMWIGGWYNNYDYVGDIDEVRVSNVIRSADWIKLEYENQKRLHTLVGPLVRPGIPVSIPQDKVTVQEGGQVTFSAFPGGVEKLYWIAERDGHETVQAVDRFKFTLDAGRVMGDKPMTLRLKSVYANGATTIDIPVVIKEQIPEPKVALVAPTDWDGRQTVEVTAQVSNLKEMQEKGAGDLIYSWHVSGLAVAQEVTPGKLILKRAQNSGELSVIATVTNGGDAISVPIVINVSEPQNDAWVTRSAKLDEKPVDNQFYARNGDGEGILHFNGGLDVTVDSVFLRVYAAEGSLENASPEKNGPGELVHQASQQLTESGTYAFTAKLKSGLIKYRIEFGSKTGETETIRYTATNIVCGDAYIINGQSNALATDTNEQAPATTSEWIRSYGKAKNINADGQQNLWCNPVWKARQGETAEVGYWGMELCQRLVKSQQVPICIFNGAAGGTRIDQHQRNPADTADLDTIYGRLFWRVREANLTHGIRAVLWHQGENDQGAAGPDGGYGWGTYQQYFVEMSAAWKEDFPNVQHYYVFQIWPNACSMGNGNGDMLREVQRTLPHLYSNMDIMSTLGITPPGGCHYPLEGWAEFARLTQPLIERDFYGKEPTGSITPPNLKRAYYTGESHDAIALEFDQPVVWNALLVDQFFLDATEGQVTSGTVDGNVLTLQLKQGAKAARISYLSEKSWNQNKLLWGDNGIAALTFSNVAVDETR
jgi:hypothetical protein